MKRATIYNKYFMQWASISIHALMKRATKGTEEENNEIFISIHALMKRATANLYNDYLYFGTKYHISDIFPQ